MKRVLAVFVGAGLTSCGSWTDVSLPAGDPERPDVVLISIDTLRADHLGAWGYSRDTSPFLDQLAGEGTRFASAWSPSPWTLPSHATLLSGWQPSRHGAVEDGLSIAVEAPWLPSAFSDAGYRTGAVVTTLFVGRKFGFDRGFSWFDDFDQLSVGESIRDAPNAEDVINRGIRWTAKEPDQPVFLFLHLYDVHYNYDPPAPWNTKFDRAPVSGDATYRKYHYYLKKPLSEEQLAHQVDQYDEEIAYVDDVLRGLREKWQKAGRSAWFVVVSDHGEEFGERGSWGHAHTLWPEQLHVPWIVTGPEVVPQVIEERVGLEDVAPTLAGLAKLSFSAGDGRDRSALLKGKAWSSDESEAAQLAETSRFKTNRLRWHEAPWDLHLSLTSPVQRQLCHLEEDPGCRTDRAASDPAVAQRLEASLHHAVGSPWTMRQDGLVLTDGIIVQDGKIRGRRVTLPQGRSLMVHPLDAKVWHQAEQRLGPWSVVGGSVPDATAPIQWQGEAREVRPVHLSPEEKQMLEALGYITEDSP